MRWNSVSLILLAAGAAFGLASACSQACLLTLCQPGVWIAVRDAQSLRAGNLKGTISNEQVLAEFDCIREVPTATVTNSAGEQGGGIDCGRGEIFFPNEFEDDLEVDITDEQGRRFVGTVRPTYTNDENANGDGCGGCSTGTATVVVE
ncbi:MAG: hypothetical protein H6729_07880 [Deltaproteobacteria bacterium]|nr:hypothetical protein [Deltaproteobacteria bacterium]